MEDLGPYVVVRPRTDGTARVLFEVPVRHRPQDWPPTIPLPLIGRTGKLDDVERRRIRQDALDLTRRMKSQPDARKATKPTLTWSRLAAIYEHSDAYTALAAASKATYQRYIQIFVETLDDEPDFAPSRVTESQVELILRMFDHSPDAKRSALTVIRLLLKKAVREGERAKALEINTRVERSSRKIGIWEQADVDKLSQACTEEGHPGLARLILTQWEIGQRLGDALNFRYGEHYWNEAFRFNQGKTDSYVTIPTPRLAELLGRDGRVGTALFINPRSNGPYTADEASYWFRNIRTSVNLTENRQLTLRSLRHSCVVQLARAGCTIAEIRSTTGHALRTVHVILEHYLPRDSICAWNAVEKRERMRAGDGPRGLFVEGEPSTFLGDRVNQPGAQVAWKSRGSRK